jgi:hypothetical protein
MAFQPTPIDTPSSLQCTALYHTIILIFTCVMTLKGWEAFLAKISGLVL